MNEIGVDDVNCRPPPVAFSLEDFGVIDVIILLSLSSSLRKNQFFSLNRAQPGCLNTPTHNFFSR